MALEWTVAFVCATGAALTDLYGRRISNRWLLICALAAAVVQIGHGAYLSALLGGAVGGAILIVPFWLGGMGAGDVKLLAAVGLALGLSGAILVALTTAVAGALLALLVRWDVGRAAAWLGRPLEGRAPLHGWWGRDDGRSVRGWAGAAPSARAAVGEGGLSGGAVTNAVGGAGAADTAGRATLPYAVAVWLGVAAALAISLAVSV